MSSVILTGDTSGTLTVSAPLVAGSNTVTLPAATGTISLLTQATAVASTSGTSIDFTGIPSWAKRITVMFSGVSTNGTSNILLRLGDAGGIEDTGYASGSSYNGADAANSTGFLLVMDVVAAVNYNGAVTFSKLDGNTYSSFGGFANNSSAVWSCAGAKTLSDTLTQVRITTVNGTDTFDAGTINIMYEG
jgi:hypothetical protein